MKGSTVIGKVYLVGAGPGDPELLTVKALRVLEQADLVLHDDLVPDSILGLVQPGAAIVNVGKRCGKKSVNQEEINARMIAGARRGSLVVRLKGGDPAIFGRAGEELQALLDSEVECEIVPGVTAASAAAAAAGISLTHRDMASSVVFLTGHCAAGKAGAAWPDLDSAKGGASGNTLVIYMPGPDYRALQERLQSAGVRDEAPCLLISAASRGGSRMHRTTLARLAETPQLPAPNILIVGEVVRLAREMKASHASWRFEPAQMPGRDVYWTFSQTDLQSADDVKHRVDGAL
jgi:uroporphyrin-III C-methyltransferase